LNINARRLINIDFLALIKNINYTYSNQSFHDIIINIINSDKTQISYELWMSNSEKDEV
jgi:hypothetical protein